MALRLLRSQENWFVEVIREAGFDPRDFKPFPTRDKNHELFGIAHPESSSFFATTPNYIAHGELGNRYRRWLCVFAPGEEQASERALAASWEDTQGLFESWLILVKREHGQPDLWKQIHEGRSLLDALRTEEAENSKFREDELAHITDALHQIQQFLLETQEFTEDTQDFVIRRLAYLEEAAKRSGRVDWKNLFVGTLMSIGVELAMNPEKFRGMVDFAMRAVRGVLALTAGG